MEEKLFSQISAVLKVTWSIVWRFLAIKVAIILVYEAGMKLAGFVYGKQIVKEHFHAMLISMMEAPFLEQLMLKCVLYLIEFLIFYACINMMLKVRYKEFILSPDISRGDISVLALILNIVWLLNVFIGFVASIFIVHRMMHQGLFGHKLPIIACMPER